MGGEVGGPGGGLGHSLHGGPGAEPPCLQVHGVQGGPRACPRFCRLG